MLQAFHGHTLETVLLKPGCTVLDVGCRGFEFGDELREKFQAKVYEVDIDDLGPCHPYYRCGIAATGGFGAISGELNPEARRLVDGTQLEVYTIDSFRAYAGADRWDVIKLDCEGSEYDILRGLTAPPATQITVEFHQHTPARRSEEFISDLIKHLQQWYDVIGHHRSGKRPSQRNYWDTLLTLKGV